MTFSSLEWCQPGTLRILDQQHLPRQLEYRDCHTVADVVEVITTMAVRGAPAIGVAAAYGMVIAAQSADDSTDAMRTALEDADAQLRASRPTAVNLFWALDQIRAVWSPEIAEQPASEVRAAIERAAASLFEDDLKVNLAISKAGAELLPHDALVFHHCNTGSLATTGYGTALGIIRVAHESGKVISVLVDETRPRLQGAKLTAWELQELGIPYRLVVDGASGHFMRTETVHACFVGCDRVAANGDTANKIGTYNLAVVARHHGVPFYVAAPWSSIDLITATGDQIPIEERSAREVTHIEDISVAPTGAIVANPAFDITPAELITAFVTERGLVYPPFTENLANQATAS